MIYVFSICLIGDYVFIITLLLTLSVSQSQIAMAVTKHCFVTAILLLAQFNQRKGVGLQTEVCSRIFVGKLLT